MINNPENQETPDYSPETRILFVRQQIATMGGNDKEFTRIDGILNELREGRLPGEEAVQKAEEILSFKHSK